MTETSLGAPKVLTFGCRLNTYESEVIKDHAVAAGETGVIFVNTCAVTAEAERQARQAIRKTRRDNPHVRIVVTGCSAQLHPDAYADMDEVDAVIGNREKLEPAAYGLGNTETVRVNDIMSVTETANHLISGMEGRARAFIQIQNGCDHRCTFCIIPYARGNSRSVAIGAITRQIRTLVDNGYNEVVLTGVDLTSYGHDLPGTPTLGQMVRRLLANVPELKRLRLSSVDPAEIDDVLLRQIAEEPRLMPHIHISLQAGDDMILKRMKRRHTRAQAVEFCERVRALRPDAAFGADIIAGFPTETETQFKNTLVIVDDCDLSYCHVFPYSARDGTPAARIPESRHVPGPERKQRAALIRMAGKRRLNALLDRMIGSTFEALAEKSGLGRAPNFAPVALDAGVVAGQLYKVNIVGRDDQVLLGKHVA